MDRDHLVKQLNTLKQKRAGGIPRQAWVSDARKIILEKAEQDAKAFQVSGRENVKQVRLVFDLGREWHRVLRPAVATFMIAALVFGGWITSVSASYNSLPGDMLYRLKLVTEQTQVAFSSGSENRVQLRVEFAGRRLDEVTKLIDSTRPEKEKQVGEAVDHFKKEIQTVNKGMDDINDKKSKTSKDSERAVEMAKMVDMKATEYQDTLSRTVEKMPVTQKAVNEAKEAVTDVEVKAVKVLVENHLSGETPVDEQEVFDKIESKLNKVQQEIADSEDKLNALGEPAAIEPTEQGDEEPAEGEAEEGEAVGEEGETGEAAPAETTDATSTQITQVKEKIEQAKTLLENKDYTGAVDAVKEVRTLAMEVEGNIVAKTKTMTTGTAATPAATAADSESGAAGASQSSASTTPTLTGTDDDKLITGQSATSTDEFIGE